MMNLKTEEIKVIAELPYSWEKIKDKTILVQKFLNKWTIFLFCSILFSSNQKEH